MPYKILIRHQGDLSACYADPKKVSEVLNWRALGTLDDLFANTLLFKQPQSLNITL